MRKQSTTKLLVSAAVSLLVVSLLFCVTLSTVKEVSSFRREATVDAPAAPFKTNAPRLVRN
jgi:hypothetical protein